MTRISGWRALGEISRGLLFRDLALMVKVQMAQHRTASLLQRGLEMHEAQGPEGGLTWTQALWKVQKHVHTPCAT